MVFVCHFFVFGRMSRKGNCWDYAVVEIFLKSLKNRINLWKQTHYETTDGGRNF